jgi:hypothetical protein
MLTEPLAALLATPNVPVRVPAAVGVNVRSIVQLLMGASDAPQVVLFAKSPVTLSTMPETTAVPVLLKVTACAALVVPMVWVANVSAAGFTLTVPCAVAETVTAAEAVAEPPAPVQASVYVDTPVPAGEMFWVPVVASLPLHAPLAVQAVALALDHVNVALPPAVRWVGDAASVTVGTGTDLVEDTDVLPADAGPSSPPPHALRAALTLSTSSASSPGRPRVLEDLWVTIGILPN